MSASRETARLTADVVLFAAPPGSLHVLLIQRGHPPHQGKWALPGGHVDDGEDTEAAARRELSEETGLTVDDLARVDVYATPGRDPRGRYVTFAYTGVLRETATPTAGDDASEAHWWPVSELTGDMLAFDHWQILIDAVDLGRWAR